jgi:asparagine synthase (glutamine-hydrolysing)
LAAKEHSGLQTFSIGFRDNKHFDESHYAEKVAAHIGSNHTTIQLYEDEMLQHVEQVLDYMDEPFADSSAIAVHALSYHTRKHVTVALSGDGADELFGGYNKHQAHLMASSPDLKTKIITGLSTLLNENSGSHSSTIGNQVRKLKRFATGQSLLPADRYWAWASWTSDSNVQKLFAVNRDEPMYRKIIADYSPSNNSMEEILLADTRMVLPDDMLRKVDRMSMANSLEVRVPFLDHRIVEYAHSLPASDRFDRGRGKHILRSAFGDLLPNEIFDRKKKGFEVPLESWFNGPLHSRLQGVLCDGILTETAWLKTSSLELLKEKLNTKQIGADVHLLWALMVLHTLVQKQLSSSSIGK